MTLLLTGYIYKRQDLTYRLPTSFSSSITINWRNEHDAVRVFVTRYKSSGTRLAASHRFITSIQFQGN